jgi:hypothetical protein
MASSDPKPLPDPIPPSEPAVPSLDGPDPGVFHHEPAPLPKRPITPAEEPR